MADKDDQAEKTIAEDLVVTKYKMAGDIANRKQTNLSPAVYTLLIEIKKNICYFWNSVRIWLNPLNFGWSEKCLKVLKQIMEPSYQHLSQPVEAWCSYLCSSFKSFDLLWWGKTN